MTEKQLAYFNDLMATAMAAVDKQIETDGAKRGDSEIVSQKMRMKGKTTATKGMIFDYVTFRTAMQAFLQTIPAEPKSIEYLKDWLWVRDFVAATPDATVFFMPDPDDEESGTQG